MRKFVALVLTATMALSLLLVGCSSPTTPITTTNVTTTTSGTTTAPSTSTAPTTVITTTQKNEEPVYGGTLRYLDIGTNPYAWDPAECDWLQGRICAPFYENLMMGDIYRGPRGTNEFNFGHNEWVPDEFLVGQMAVSWEVTDTQIIWHLRPGMMWPAKPGIMASREIVAKDAELALKRYMVSPKSSVGRFDWANSLTATDKYTLVLEYNTFSADWSYLLGWGWATDIYPPEIVNAPDGGISNWKNANGSGPFMLSDFVSGSSITYVKNPNYWGKTKINGKEYQMPFIDKITMLLISDESTRLAATQTGKVDLNLGMSWKYEKTLASSNPELNKFQVNTMTCTYISMRCDQAPFNDRNVRLAMSMALNRAELTKYPDLAPVDNPNWNNWPFGVTYPESIYTKIEDMPESIAEQYKYDPDKAKQLLTEAGYPNGFSTTMICDGTTPNAGDFGSMMKAMWAAIGVNVEVKPMEFNAFQSTFLAKNHTGMMGPYSKGLVHPITALRYQLPGQPWGPSAWYNAEYDAKYYAMKAEKDDTTRAAMQKEMSLMLIDAIAYIPIRASYYYVYTQPRVKNYFGEINLGYHTDTSQALSSLWIDPTIPLK